jgi:hypothetical protein
MDMEVSCRWGLLMVPPVISYAPVLEPQRGHAYPCTCLCGDWPEQPAELAIDCLIQAIWQSLHVHHSQTQASRQSMKDTCCHIIGPLQLSITGDRENVRHNTKESVQPGLGCLDVSLILPQVQ